MTPSTRSQVIMQEPPEDYKSALARCTIQTSIKACGQSYVRVSKLKEWWGSETNYEGQSTSQATRWLEYAYRNWLGHSHSIPMSKRKLIGSVPCILIFSILLEIGWGDLIHLFELLQDGPKNDRSLPFNEQTLRQYIEEMATLDQRPREIPVEAVSSRFFRAQWKYCPAMFGGEFRNYGPSTIIPIHRKELISDKGGTANLYQIEVLSEFVGEEIQREVRDSEYTPIITDEDKQGPRFHFALKTYNNPGGKETCLNEVDAFRALKQHDGMVRYLGAYTQDPLNQFPDERDVAAHGASVHKIYNIILQYGERDLNDLFFGEIPPILESEIKALWDNLFELAETVNRFHNLSIITDGITKYYSGWHADIKPDNILEISGKFKLADPGFAGFMPNLTGKGLLDNKAPVRGGTSTFGAPELHAGIFVSAEAHRAIDVWSLGCVFSVTATWVALGREGIKQYTKLRKQAIRKRREEQDSYGGESSSRLDYGDYFHNGVDVLQEVTDWHKYLRAVLRKTDKSTSFFLDLVDRHMLVGAPDKRSKACDLSTNLELIRSDPEHIEPPIPDSIVVFLKDLNEGIYAELTSSTITYESVPRNLPPHSTFKDRQDQKSKYLESPLIPTSLRSQRLTGRRISRVARNIVESTIAEERSPQGSLTKFDNSDRASSETISPRAQMLPRRTSRMSSSAGKQYPIETISEASAKFDEEKKNRSFFHHMLSNSSSKKDMYLARHYSHRDIIFLIDNSASMSRHWDEVKYDLKTLLRKVKGLDDNGVDLSFTLGAVRIDNEKDTKRILLKLDDPHALPMETVTTDILVPLGRVFTDYSNELRKGRYSNSVAKSMTLMVLSDGLWNNPKEEVGDRIVDFIQLFKKIKKERREYYEDHQCTIEFIQYGNHPIATETFQYLDDDLEAIPDVVDHEHRDGNIMKMLLGSFVKQYDDLPSLSTENLAFSYTELEDSATMSQGGPSRQSTLPYGSQSPTPQMTHQSRRTTNPPSPSDQVTRRSTAQAHGSFQHPEPTMDSRTLAKSNSLSGPRKKK